MESSGFGTVQGLCHFCRFFGHIARECASRGALNSVDQSVTPFREVHPMDKGGMHS